MAFRGSRPRKLTRAGGRVADGDGVGEDLGHPLVGRERLALADADRGGEAAQLGVDEVDRLLLDDVIELLVELEIVGVDRVERHLRPVDELHLRRVARLAERIDLDALAEHLRSRVRLAVHEEAAKSQEVHIRWRLRDEIAAFRQLALVAGWDDQILAALALVRAGCAHVHDETEERVVDRAGSAARRNLDNGRPVGLQIEEAHAIHGIRVAGEQQRIGVEQLIVDDELVGLGRAYCRRGPAGTIRWKLRE